MRKESVLNLYDIDCTCLDLYDSLKKEYVFQECEVLKKCLQNGRVKGMKSVCITGKEGTGKTILITEILAELSAVSNLKGMNLKVMYLDCDLTFQYKNYEEVLKRKFSKYIHDYHTKSMDEYAKVNYQTQLLKDSFSNVYYMPVYNPAHLIIILNSLKNILLKNPHFIEALILDSLSTWNFIQFDKINFFSHKTAAERTITELLDYSYTLILNLKKEYEFLFFYTKVCVKKLTDEYVIKIPSKQKKVGIHKKRRVEHEVKRTLNPLCKNVKNEIEETLACEEKNIDKKFLLPHNFDKMLRNNTFLKKSFKENNYFIEDPLQIYLFLEEKKDFSNITKKEENNNLESLLCISSDMVDLLDKNLLSDYIFVIKDPYSIVPL